MRTDRPRASWPVAILLVALAGGLLASTPRAAAAEAPPAPPFPPGAGAWRSEAIPPLSLAIPGEVDIVGLAIGVRPAMLVRPLWRWDPAFTLRFSVGILPGPEFFYLPLSAGVRGVVAPRRRVHPYGGVGLEFHSFFVDDRAPFVRGGVYFEAGVRVDVTEDVGIFFEAAPELGMAPLKGFGLALRLGVELALPHRGP